MAKNTLTFTKVGQCYETEYTGDSGVLQLKLYKDERVKVLGDAGAGYAVIALMSGEDIMAYLNMDGFDKVKIVSYAAVVDGLVNTN